MKTTTAPKSRKRRIPGTNLQLNKKAVEIAREYFKGTNHGSLSGWANSALIREIRKNVVRLRKLGFDVPQEFLQRA